MAASRDNNSAHSPRLQRTLPRQRYDRNRRICGTNCHGQQHARTSNVCHGSCRFARFLKVSCAWRPCAHPARDSRAYTRYKDLRCVLSPSLLVVRVAQMVTLTVSSRTEAGRISKPRRLATKPRNLRLGAGVRTKQMRVRPTFITRRQDRRRGHIL